MPDHDGRFDVEAVRRRFPALALERDGRPMAFFDGPGGTQVVDDVIAAVSRYYLEQNANSGGPFLTSERTDALSHEAHAAMAAMLGADDPGEIKFGANMTSLTFHVSRSIGAALSPGDEVVVTVLDHEANVGPWLAMAGDRGLRVRRVDIRADDCTLDLESLDRALTPSTRLVAVGWASNAVGTINPVAEIAARARAVGAWTFVDAVAYAPHAPIDVKEIGADFLACSPYKFFGPHAGVLFGRREVLERLPAYKVRPAHDRFETGTPSFEAQAGVLAAVDYLAWLGRAVAGSSGATRRPQVLDAMAAIRTYEMDLFRRLLDGLEQVRGLRLFGIADRDRFDERTPTAAVTVEGIAPRALAEALGREAIATWDGDFYATGLIERLGLANDGGVLRIGLMHYNTADEVDRLVEALDRIAVSARGLALA